MAVFYSVSKINEYISKIFEEDHILKDVNLCGEVFSISEKSDNFYITLKDDKASIAAVAFGKYDRRLYEEVRKIEVGMKVKVNGSIKVYKERGSYQIYIKTIEEEGLGEIYQKFAKVFAKLKQAGYFDESYKKPIPEYVQKLGVVTSGTGAAIEDIKKIAYAKNPHIEIILVPSLVQGADAPIDLVKSIQIVDTLGCDCVIVGRGGGSKEDLDAFNDERVAMAIWNMKTPVISAVGHEVDSVITDFIADSFAPTPTAASDMAVFDYNEFVSEVESYKKMMEDILYDTIAEIKNRINVNKLKLESLSPKNKIESYKKNLINYKKLIKDNMSHKIVLAVNRLKIITERIDGLSPLKRIYEGYSYVTNEKGKNIKSIKDIKTGASMRTRVSDGYIISTVDNLEKLSKNER